MFLFKLKNRLNSKINIMYVLILLWLIGDCIIEFTFPSYLESIGFSYFEVGLFVAIGAFAGFLVDVPFGMLSNLVSKRRLMIYSVIVSVITTILIFLIQHKLIIFALVFFWGISFSLWCVPKDAFFASLTHKKKRGKQYGFHCFLESFSQGISPLFAGLVIVYLGFKGIISVYVLIVVTIIVILLISIKETNRRSIRKVLKSSFGFKQIYNEFKDIKKFGVLGILLFYYCLLFTFWENILWTFEPLFYGENGLGVSAVMGGILLASFSLPGILFSYFFGKFSDKKNKKALIFWGLLIAGISLVLFSKISNIYVLILLGFIVSTGEALAAPSLKSLLVEISHGQKKGKFSGTLNFFVDIGYVLGPLTGGLIAQQFGLKCVFMSMGIIFIFSSCLLLFIKFKDNSPRQ